MDALMQMTLFPYLQPWLLPPGLNIALILIGLICISLRCKRTGIGFASLGFVSLWLFSTPIVAYNLIGLLQNDYSQLNLQAPDKLAPADAIVVLGGGEKIQYEYNYKFSVSNITAERLDYAMHLQAYLHLPLIVSGGKTNGAPASIAELMDKYLQERYHFHALYLENLSHTTADESQLLRTLLIQHHLNTVYLVTNAWHMPRSIYAFQRAGIKVIPAPMGYYFYGPGYSLLSFLPDKEALYASTIALHEYIGLFWYYLYLFYNQQG